VCGRYTNTSGPEELNDRFRVPITGPEGTHRYNIAPTEQVLAIIERKGEEKAELMRWGLVPSWASEIKGNPLMINARMESVTSTPAYKRLIPRGERRALQLADGYYEWLKPEKRGEPRQPFLFRVDGGVPFAFASLWTPAKVDGEWLHSITLLTCDAAPNRVAAAIATHSRPGSAPTSARRKPSRCAERCPQSASPRTRRTPPSTRSTPTTRDPSCCIRRTEA
jgi:putative SOS response-associated peptidase YedK